MAVRFGPRIVSEEEQAALNRPTSTGLPQPPDPTAPHGPVPPPPTEAFPQPPSGPPPMRRNRRDITLPFRPSVWDVAHELYYWARPTTDISRQFPNFPQDWSLEHASLFTPSPLPGGGVIFSGWGGGDF